MAGPGICSWPQQSMKLIKTKKGCRWQPFLEKEKKMKKLTLG